MASTLKKLGRLHFFDSSEIGREPPAEITLLRFGRNKLTKGGERMEFEFSERDADMILSDFSERGKDVVLDYEHQTLKGVEAPAAGWIDKLEKTGDGLKARVKYWTDKATEYLKTGEYRYFSPVVDFTRRKASLHSVALTNHPALHGIPALVADDMGCGEMEDEDVDIETPSQENTMKCLKEIAQALDASIPDDADESKAMELVLGGVNALKSKLSETEGKIAGMVSMTDLESAKKEIAEMKARQAVKDAIASRKLAPEQEEPATRLAMSDMEAFGKLVAAAKMAEEPKEAAPAAPAGKIDPSVAAPDPKASMIAMSDDELKVYRTMGLNAEQIEKIKSEKKK